MIFSFRLAFPFALRRQCLLYDDDADAFRARVKRERYMRNRKKQLVIRINTFLLTNFNVMLFVALFV